METVETPVAQPQTLRADAAGIYHPTSDADVQALVQKARAAKGQLRVVGAAQSVNEAIYTDDYSGSNDTPNINIMLDQMRSVMYDEANMQVTAGAGLSLGYNPFDPTKTSTETNGLFFQLQQKGWAIANVTDAIHQTLGGFVSTGSAAGSMMHSFDEAIRAFTIVDGNGEIKTFTRSANLDDAFFAIGSSMGLLGVITSVTLQCIPAFNIIGQERVSAITETEMDFFGHGSHTQASLQKFFTATEYARIMWWPISSLQRAIVWKAQTMTANDYNDKTGTPQNFTPQPYQPIFPKIAGSSFPSEAFASLGFKLINAWPAVVRRLIGDYNDEETLNGIIEIIGPALYGILIDQYFPCNTAARPPQVFWDTWLGSLPMDSVEFSNNLFNLVYAEIVVPLKKAHKVVNLFQQRYTQGGYAATGCFTVEVLAAKKSEFWLSPFYGEDAVRLNILRFDAGEEANRAYFQQFWNLLVLNGIDFRVHWGKYLPSASGATGAAYLKKQFSKWNDFMALRKKMDPDGIFVNSYWKEHLDI